MPTVCGSLLLEVCYGTWYIVKSRMVTTMQFVLQIKRGLCMDGAKGKLFCIIFSRANGNPGPDPYYIDQAKKILYELENLDIPAVCDGR